METTLRTVIKESTSVTCDYYKDFLKLLYKSKKYNEVFTEAINMHKLYENNVYPLEWICKIYVEMVIEENSIVTEFENKIEPYCDKLLELQTDAIMGVFTKSVFTFKKQQYCTSREYLKKGIYFFKLLLSNVMKATYKIEIIIFY